MFDERCQDILIQYIVPPIITLFIGMALDRYLERRPRLIRYLAHTAAVEITQPDSDPYVVHTHAIVVRNAGKKPAKNVRLGHQTLPNFTVYPSIDYEMVNLPDGSIELLFPRLVPGEQLSVTYLYFQPVVWKDINTYTKSDDGFAEIIYMLPTPQSPVWLVRASWILMFIGLAAISYGAVELVRFVLSI